MRGGPCVEKLVSLRQSHSGARNGASPKWNAFEFRHCSAVVDDMEKRGEQIEVFRLQVRLQMLQSTVQIPICESAALCQRRCHCVQMSRGLALLEDGKQKLQAYDALQCKGWFVRDLLTRQRPWSRASSTRSRSRGHARFDSE